MLHRRHTEDAWNICEGTDEGHAPDSRVHMYGREVGFAIYISAEELKMVGLNTALAEAERGAALAKSPGIMNSTCTCKLGRIMFDFRALG